MTRKVRNKRCREKVFRRTKVAGLASDLAKHTRNDYPTGCRPGRWQTAIGKVLAKSNHWLQDGPQSMSLFASRPRVWSIWLCTNPGASLFHCFEWRMSDWLTNRRHCDM